MSEKPKKCSKDQLKLTNFFDWKINCVALTGFLIFGVGVNLLIFQNLITERVTKSIIVLNQGTPLSDFWQKLPIEVPTNVYFFNWTNPQDFYNPQIKPKFTQMGPYTYLQSMERINVTWNKNHTITFNQVRHFYYDDKHKNGNLSDAITTLNVIEMGGTHYLQNWDVFIKSIFQSALLAVDPDYYITKTAQQHIEGYQSGVLDLLNYFEHLAPDLPRFDKFGWLSMRNKTPELEGTFNIQDGLNRNFEVLQWNHRNTTPFYGKECNQIRGSMGELHSFKKTRNYIYVFLPDLCRAVRLDFEEEVVVDGILGHKYSGLDGAFDNGTKVPGNECFCTGKCIPYGMINISSCYWGLNFYFSLPHYYGADPIYLNAVEGLQPQKLKHEAYLIIEPVTFVVLDFKARVQFNIFVHPIEGFSVFQNVREIYFPILWAEQTTSLPENIKAYLRYVLNVPYVIGWAAGISIILGAFIICFSIYKVSVLYALKKTQLSKELHVSKQEFAPLPEETQKLMKI